MDKKELSKTIQEDIKRYNSLPEEGKYRRRMEVEASVIRYLMGLKRVYDTDFYNLICST